MNEFNDLPPDGNGWRLRASRVPKPATRPKQKTAARRGAQKKAAPSKTSPNKMPGRGKGAVSHSRVWFSQDKALAAFHASAGRSGAEIADILGGTTAAKVRAMIDKVGIKMRRRLGGEELIMVRWSRSDHNALHALADELDYEVEDIAAAALREILADPEPLLRHFAKRREDGP